MMKEPQGHQPYKHLTQNSREWKKARENCDLTSTEVAKICTCDINSQVFTSFFAKKYAHRSSSSPPLITSAMQWGHDKEPVARDIYESLFNVDVEQSGLWIREEIDLRYNNTVRIWGASPDGIDWKNQTLLEIKCPMTAPYYTYIPKDHIIQMQVAMQVIGLEKAHYAVYSERTSQFGVREMKRDDSLWDDFLHPAMLDFSRKMKKNITNFELLGDAEFQNELNDCIGQLRRSIHRVGPEFDSFTKTM